METTAADDLLARALKVLGDAIDISFIVAGPHGELCHANPGARRLLGWEGPEGLAGRSLESIPVAASLQSRLQRDPGPWEEETTVEVRGRTVPVTVGKQPLADRGRRLGSLVVIHDLADVADAIVERDRARRNDRAKTRSLHMVAHDMSGPLTILSGYVSLVHDGSLRIEELEPYLPMLADQLAHMQRLVNVLLDTARLEEGHIELRLEPLDLAAFVENLVRRMRTPETGHNVVVRREADELPVVADPVRLDSIVRNLISNAVKYSPEGSTITCTVRRDDGATLEVADEGTGIDAADLDRLFTRFGRVGDPVTNPPGVGLGLFLSRELARLHGGDLDAASEVGKGSRFSLRLPLRDSGRR